MAARAARRSADLPALNTRAAFLHAERASPAAEGAFRTALRCWNLRPRCPQRIALDLDPVFGSGRSASDPEPRDRPDGARFIPKPFPAERLCAHRKEIPPGGRK